MTDHYYTVGVHGPPTEETAPHGFMWRQPQNGDEWVSGRNLVGRPSLSEPLTEWYPFPAPPTTPAPKPEPVERWVAREIVPGRSFIRDDRMDPADNTAAAAALNDLHDNGVAWGEPRPPETLPETGRVLVQWRLLVSIERAEYLRDQCMGEDDSALIGWWPLPGGKR